MKRTKAILMGILFLSVLAVASCGSKQAKKECCKEGEKKECCKEGEKKECCEKKDSTACEKKDTTACEMKCKHEKAACSDSTKKTE